MCYIPKLCQKNTALYSECQNLARNESPSSEYERARAFQINRSQDLFFFLWFQQTVFCPCPGFGNTWCVLGVLGKVCPNYWHRRGCRAVIPVHLAQSQRQVRSSCWVPLVQPVKQNLRPGRSETFGPGHAFLFQKYANARLRTTLASKVETSKKGLMTDLAIICFSATASDVLIQNLKSVNVTF